MKTTSGCLSDYEIRAMATKHDSAKSSVGNCTKESFLVGERNLLEVCAVAVRAAQVFAGNQTELWVSFMVGPLPHDAGVSRRSRRRSPNERGHAPGALKAVSWWMCLQWRCQQQLSQGILSSVQASTGLDGKIHAAQQFGEARIGAQRIESGGDTD